VGLVVVEEQHQEVEVAQEIPLQLHRVRVITVEVQVARQIMGAVAVVEPVQLAVVAQVQ
jgi:hypothetical protein